MFRRNGQEPFIAFAADSGAGSGGSAAGGDGAGSPGAGGAADSGGTGEKSGGDKAPGGQSDKAGDGGTGGVTAKTFDEAYVKELRDEAAKHRRDKAAVEAKLKAIEDAKLSEDEKRAKRMQELEAENARLLGETRRAAILAAAATAGAIVPEAVVGLVPADAEDVKQAVAAVKREYGDLFRKPVAGSADAGAGTGDQGKKPVTDMNMIIRRAAGRIP
jgi:hypothetical protein